MKKLLLGVATAVLGFGIGNAQAVELLTSGDFESPDGPEIPGWQLAKFITGSSAETNSAELKDFDPDTPPNDLWLRSFESGGPLGADEGNFDIDVPNDVDGNDFLEWQRGNSPTAPLSPEDLATWEDNFGRQTGLLTNAILAQTVPGTAGETYTFKGSSRWETNYSGGVATLDAGGPLGAVASPTTTTMELAFLNAAGTVIGSPVTLDLRDEQTNFNFWVEHTLNGVAPTGTASVRVTAEARDMVWNGVAEDGLNQTAFYDSFALTGAGAPVTELLTNPDLDEDLPSALDFWTLTEDPASRDEILRTANFANHTPGGTLGVWLSAFLGEHPNFEPTPVDGTMAQTVAAVPGGSYTFTGWSRFELNYSGGVDTIDPSSGGNLAGQPSPTETQMELAFLDGSDAVIGVPIVLDVKADREAACGVGNANSGACDWQQHTLQGVAPVDAVSVRVSGKMIDGVFNIDPGQSAFFDDFSLDGPAPLVAASVVPEPTSVVSLALGLVMLGLGRTRRLSRASA